jgi:hypothetical protein
MQVHCLYDELAKIDQLKPHPKNRNTHPPDQIDRLAEILRYVLDLSGINADLADLGPDFDIDFLGIKDFVLDLAEKEIIEDEPEPAKNPVVVQCPNCGECFNATENRAK